MWEAPPRADRCRDCVLPTRSARGGASHIGLFLRSTLHVFPMTWLRRLIILFPIALLADFETL
jgi:hypothetical protein